MPGDFVQIDAFGHEIEAHLSGMRLEWAGIKCFYFDEYTVAFFWLYSFAIGRVKLTVLAGDAEKAIEILAEKPPAMVPDESATYDPTLPRCPHCASPDVYPEKINRRLSYALWLALFAWISCGPIAIPTRSWKCIDCGRRWKPN